MRVLKYRRFGFALLMMVMFVISAINCSVKAHAAEVPKLARTAIVLEEGKKTTLTLKKKIPGSSLKWSTKNARVARVSKEGVVKGVESGETVITCKVVVKSGTKKKTYRLACNVKVNKPSDTYYRKNVKLSDSNSSYCDDGISYSRVQQFTYKDEGMAYAYLVDGILFIITPKKELKINAKYSRLGDVIADEQGNFYVIWGEKNPTDDASVKTTVISKYDAEGNEIKSTGFVGESTPWYDSDEAKTQYPFYIGNCVSVIHDHILVCYHAKRRYDGHQCDQVIAVNIDTMEEYKLPNNTYTGHSFNQDVIYCDKIQDFLFASLGDASSRGFRVNRSDGEYGNDKEVLFHFYLDANVGYDMDTINITFAQLGGIEQINDKVVLVGASVKSLGENSKKQKQNLFIQIFDPSSGEVNEKMFVGGERRTGKTALDMFDTELTPITDYGVIWLTDYTDRDVVAPQVIAADNRIVIMWSEDESDTSSSMEIVGGTHFLSDTTNSYYMVLSEDGKIITPKTFLGDRCLNSNEKPIFYNGKVYWVNILDYTLRVKSISIGA